MAETTYLEHLQNNPLFALSLYSGLQADILKRLEAEILLVLDGIRRGDDGRVVIESGSFHDAYGKFWLWVLGAYEIVRTLTDRRCEGCLTTEAADRMRACRRQLARIRVPFAKQELQRPPGQRRGNGAPIGGELSISSFDGDRHDMGFDIQGHDVWMRETINVFRSTLDSITLDDVLKEIPRRPPEPVGQRSKGD